MSTTKKANKPSTKARPRTPAELSGYILPADAKHYMSEDALLAPVSMFGGMASSQMARPALIVIQHKSRLPEAEKHIGEIYNTVTGEYHKEVKVAFVVAPSADDVPRSMRAKAYSRNGNEVYDPDAPIVCGSPNGVVPYVNYIGVKMKDEVGEEFSGEVIPDQCDGCIFNSAWLCKPVYRYYVLQIHTDGRVTPAVMRLKGRQMEAAKKLNTTLAMAEQSGKYWMYIMTTERAQSQNIVYVPVFTPSEQVTDPEFIQYVIGLNREYRATQKRILEDANLRIQQMKEDAE